MGRMRHQDIFQTISNRTFGRAVAARSNSEGVKSKEHYNGRSKA